MTEKRNQKVFTNKVMEIVAIIRQRPQRFHQYSVFWSRLAADWNRNHGKKS